MKWPLTGESIRQLLLRSESDLLEFKRVWPDLNSGQAKAEFIRDVLAMANSTRPEQPSYMIFGVEDARHGGRVIGVSSQPSPEQIAQILAAYTMPVPDARLQNAAYEGLHLTIVGLFWNASHPYAATREMSGVLMNDVAYVRRGPTVGTMTVPELEIAIRQKDSRIGSPVVDVSLQVGFVEEGSLSGPRGTVVRVVNVSGESVSGVNVILDVALAAEPSVRCRERKVVNGTIEPGKAQESELKLHELHFRRGDELLEWQSKAFYRALNITLYVQYRDRFGFLRQIVQELATCA